MVEPLFKGNVAGAVAGAEIALTGSEGKHAVAVRRMRVGEGIQLTDGLGKRVRGNVSAVEQNSLMIRVTDVIDESEPSAKLTLIQALAKGDRDELAVQAATELGAWQIIPWQAERSISRWDGPKISKGVDRWQVIVAEAAKQSLRVFEPNVQLPVSTKQICELVKDFDLILVLDPTAAAGLGSQDFSAQNIAIVVGPEGGISDHELQFLADAGARRVNLGAPILRTSTAGVAAISVILAKLGYWN
ncbi:16S rRNA (uracil(1498)-N(3))-methyltransferase [Rhodoluna sp.]|jgi:16S rRNA (uracil1498-N3)-methyltransferase|uniref:16S rRNA (uracil(1498)-N(3))-methyltransferase n=1 Tax=Rhodoluna sp. TaxID=1969481 RepID=UPI0025D40B00|nr:16S rRNA (uracil(1498)-N(3))-methyltransferase [Rhodoluna sp.]